MSKIDKQPGKPNLKRGNPAWGHGKSGNPNGRPKKELCIPDILRGIGDEPVSELMLARLRAKWGPDIHPKTNREAMLMVAFAQAQEGDSVARQFVAERTEGKVTDKLELDDVTPREVVFKEVRLGDSVQTITVKRTIPRDNANS